MTTNDALLKTPLYNLHLELGAKMVPFAGYQMPVQYPLGVKNEHLHTRAKAGLFDVSHMGQVQLFGDQAAQALERLVPVDIIELPVGKQRYALFTNDQGGILDDLMVSNMGDFLFLVVNAACKEQDIAHLQQHLPADVKIKVLTDRALLALQGPEAANVLARLAPSVNDMVFMDSQALNIKGIDCFISRSGYTGEDGFEISVPADQTETLARLLLAEPEVEAIGLGARDSLRLEAGLCLYGHDLDITKTPLESSLIWAISKSRRPEGSRAGGFIGEAKVLEQITEKNWQTKRVGLLPQGKAPIREGTVLINSEGKEIGKVTSGGFGPSFGGPIAMGYVETAYSTLDTEIFAQVRGKSLPVKVAKTPFVEQRYYRG
ncbi:glycine cleavage system aminomethyltransferase GcvT [Spartinivicinus ruber]|uniref:glycine cleavage system aminomethyltransferase GcvT n=1 Tax=Spartinivicinus ruber TaxID=2683272 RepID=UPI0013D141F2|nr:glycine cleavage system aminomethyltransferase GcvT [Spartinivicinus ruber]